MRTTTGHARELTIDAISSRPPTSKGYTLYHSDPIRAQRLCGEPRRQAAAEPGEPEMAPGQARLSRRPASAVVDAAGGPGSSTRRFQPGRDCKLIPARIAL